MKKGIAVFFPGTGYTCKEKLFVEFINKYEKLGYDTVSIDFSMISFEKLRNVDEAIEEANIEVMIQLKEINFEEYGDVIFISKSLGTVCAGYFGEKLMVSPRQLYLTPLKETVTYIDRESKIIGVVIGDEDKNIDYRELLQYCNSKEIACIVFNNVGHKLKRENDEDKTNEINSKIIGMCFENI